jgi:multiple sugar transport system permease protein
MLKFGLIHVPLIWLGSKRLAMAAIIVVNAWRGFPFFGIILYAGLLSIPRSLYEAARVDGATWWKELFFITLPMLRIVLIILTLYSVIFTFSEFTVIYVLTRGGPVNATHVFSTLSYQRGIMSGNIGEAAAITLYLFPVFLIVAIGMLRFSWKEREL